MKAKVKKVLAVIIVLLVAFGWYATCLGVGPVESIKDTMKFGLDINGGVYVVLEADQ